MCITVKQLGMMAVSQPFLMNISLKCCVFQLQCSEQPIHQELVRFSLLLQFDISLHIHSYTYAHSVNCEWNVGGTCEHEAKSGQYFYF